MRTAGIRFWLRSVAAGAGVGLLVGLVVGGTLGRVFMRLLFLAREDSRGFETSMGAIVGDLTAGGSFFIAVSGAALGLVLGIGYSLLRGLMPHRLAWREAAFTLAATGLMLWLLVRANLEDFTILPVTLSLLLLGGSVALTAAPVPALVGRLAPDRDRTPGTASRALLGAAGLAIAVYAATAIAQAYSA